MKNKIAIILFAVFSFSGCQLSSGQSIISDNQLPANLTVGAGQSTSVPSLSVINQPINGTTTEIIDKSSADLVWLAFTPKQCQETPWQKWSEPPAGNKYIKQPTEQELIVDYLAQQEIEIAKIEIIRPADLLVCQACFTCDKGYYVNIQTDKKYRERLNQLGWKNAIKVK